jgi:hypothetical protein
VHDHPSSTNNVLDFGNVNSTGQQTSHTLSPTTTACSALLPPYNEKKDRTKQFHAKVIEILQIILHMFKDALVKAFQYFPKNRGGLPNLTTVLLFLTILYLPGIEPRCRLRRPACRLLCLCLRLPIEHLKQHSLNC